MQSEIKVTLQYCSLDGIIADYIIMGNRAAVWMLPLVLRINIVHQHL